MAMSGHRVLIVDDNETTRLLLTRILQPLGMETVEAVDGIDALDKFQQLRFKKPGVSLIITDMNMPNMDGMTFVRRARTINKTTPILFITAQQRQELKDQGEEAGVSGWIVKPFVKETVQEIVKSVLGLG